MSTVLITGGARRLGREIALYLAKEGWDIALHHNMSRWPSEETVEELRALGVRAQGFRADLSNEEECQALIPAVVKEMGPVTALINNASMFVYDVGESFSYRRFQNHMMVNAAAAVMLTQCFYQHLTEHNEALAAEGESEKSIQGVVVNMLDQKLWNLNHDFLSYTLSKAALKAATEMLARELAPTLRVVGVAPGLTISPASVVDRREFDRMHAMSPLGASSSAEEVAQTIDFVLKNRALTGTSLVVDGGQHLMHLPRDFTRL